MPGRRLPTSIPTKPSRSPRWAAEALLNAGLPEVQSIGDTEMVSTPEELVAAAAAVRADLALDDVLGALGEPHLVGSAALGLMVWPDLDITVVCDALDVAGARTARRSTS